MPELAYLNGQIMPVEKAMVPVDDRGYLFGDAVYEYIASYGGRLFRMDDHIRRLENSLRGLDFPPVDPERVRQAVSDLLEAGKMERAGIYIQISRGVEPRNHAFSNQGPVQVVMTVRPLPDVHPHLEKGAAVMTAEDFRWGRCDIKTVQILPNCLAKQKAVDNGLYDAIFVSGEKIVREATSSNVFIVADGKVLTHPLTNNILPGITRKVVLEICRDKGIPAAEEFFDTQRLQAADEVFLSGTTTEVLPVVAVDGRRIADGQAGSVTMKLYGELRRLAGA